jgi:DNA processing protein
MTSPTASQADRVARAALSRLSEPGDLRLMRLVAEVGAEQVYDALLHERDVLGVYTDVAARLRGLDPERELAEAAANDIRFVVPGEPEWPARLDELSRVQVLDRGGPPLGLWLRGPLDLSEATARSVAVVGSRSATTYGADISRGIGAGLAAAGVCVTSGAAYGIDQAAHRGALAGKGATVAVLACGADRAYPPGHQTLLDYIADNGLVVSELPPGSAPTRLRFLTRNRIIAALGLGTVVVEAAVRSGALNTANWTSRLGRVLMGVPGPVTSAPSEGVHGLIRSAEAVLVTNAAEVLELVSPAGSFLTVPARAEPTARDRLPAVDARVLEAVPAYQGAPAAAVARTAGVSQSTADAALQRLSAAGLAESQQGRWRLTADSRV